jgi:adenylate cyclase
MAHVRAHNAIMRDCLAEHRGVEVKHTGDGIMASFASVGRAVECAISVQRALANHNDTNADMTLRVRIGMSAGEPVAEHQDLFGAAVNLARRTCDFADAGQILVTSVVRDLSIGKTFRFVDRGDATLRGFADPVRLFEVDWRA